MELGDIVDKLKANTQHIVVMLVLFVLCFNRWRLDTANNDIIVDQMTHSPAAYRLWTQFLLLFNENPFSFVALLAVIFAVTSAYLYWICPDNEKMVLFGFLTLVIMFGSLRQAPAYLLLLLAVTLREKDWSVLLVVPITAVKEHAGLIYIIFLFSTKKYKEAVAASILWGATYAAIHLIIGPVSAYIPPDAPEMAITTPILTLDPYILRLSLPTHWKNWANIFGNVLMAVLLVNDRKESLVFLLNLPIITFFGIFYESQLWLMPAIAVIFGRMQLTGLSLKDLKLFHLERVDSEMQTA
ncbi:MAG: hypothetical protein ACFFFK_01165 [Candidatus Thorarchaeota archaeon]